MNKSSEIYVFDNFRLETSDKTLFQNEKSLPLTPKMFETLLVLIENAGRVVEKDELMQRVWHDRYVEENNLTFNIKMLRKVLGDDAKNPKFIETIPRRGYRFVAELKEPFSEEPVNITTSNRERPNHVFGRSRLVATAIFMVAICSVGSAMLVWQKESATIPLLSNQHNLVKLSKSGFASGSGISADGGRIAYIESTSKMQSVWIREIESGKITNLIPATEEYIFHNITFLSNGDDLLITANLTGEKWINVYSFSISKGNLTKVITNSEGSISISPDDSKIIFIRYDNDTSRQNKLMIADIDGKNERVISQTEPGNVYWTVDFSRDGKKIAAAYGHTNSASRNMSLVEVDAEKGEQKEISQTKFFNIKSIEYLKDQKNLIISASEPDEPYRLWQVDLANGNCLPLSFDSENYSRLSLSSENDKLTSVTVTGDYNLFSGELGNESNSQKLAQARQGFAFTPDNKIIYSAESSEAGSADIWVMNADGTNQIQLTTDKRFDGYPITSSDNQFIYFSSNRSGETHVWRMKLDGAEQTQVTKGEGGYPMFASSDGETLYYQKSHTKGIWQLSLTNGSETEIVPKKSQPFAAFSPDGRNLVFVSREKDQTYRIDMMDLETKTIVKSFPSLEKNTYPELLYWIPNTNSFSYVLDKHAANDSLWIQDINDEKPKFVQEMGNEDVSVCKFSPDGKNFSFIRGTWKRDVVLITGLK